uniref:Uncharacterized protein n=1 Tax=Rhizophora mucronata TaxID=61149 RepID=A0A2P2Q1A3_RHIMU
MHTIWFEACLSLDDIFFSTLVTLLHGLKKDIFNSSWLLF